MFEIEKPKYLQIINTEKKIPIQNLYFVGRNYAEHALEMGENEKNPPFFFSKPTWTVAKTTVPYPKDTKKLQHEVELVIAIGEKSKIYGFCVGVDLTRRDLQKNAKINGKPWFQGKTFQGSSVLSNIILYRKNIDFTHLELELFVNDKLKQRGKCSEMICSPSEIICDLSRDFSLRPGDLIFTGTPSGVGDLKKGDRITASIPGYIDHNFKIT